MNSRFISEVNFFLFNLNAIKLGGNGNSIVDAVIIFLKGYLPFVVTTSVDGKVISVWLTGIKIKELFAAKRKALSFNCSPYWEEDLNLMLHELNLAAKKLKFSELQIRSYAINRVNIEMSNILVSNYSAEVDVFSSYINEIDSLEKIEKIPNDRRRLYQKGKEEGLTSKSVGPFRMIKLASYAYIRRGDKFPLSSKIRLFIFWIISKVTSRVHIRGAYVGHEVQNFALIQMSNENAVYLYGGSINSPHRTAGVFIQVETMKEMSSLGCKNYDFGGASNRDKKASSISLFKKKFGGFEKRYANLILKF